MSAVMSESSFMPTIARFKEWLIYSLVFLFPIAGTSVRHWFSGIFSVLVLISLWDLMKKWGQRPALYKEEKIWLWLCAAFFLTFMISSLWNGWGHLQNRALGVDIRYLAVVPLFLMLRQYPNAWRFLLAGLLVAAPILAAQAYYDIEVLNLPRAQGPYSPNLFGPVAALVLVWLLSSWRQWGRLRWLLPLLVGAALWAVALSGSRGAYFGLLVMLLLWIGLFLKGWRQRIPAVVAVLMLPVVIYHVSPSVAQRVDGAASEINTYIEMLGQGKHYTGGAAVRFEMWRAGWMVFKDAPILGVGPSNYTEAVRQYVGKDGLPNAVAHHGQAHSAYVEALMTRGMIGFIVFLAMLFYPLYCYLKWYKVSPSTAIFGMVQIVGFAAFSITDASTFDKGNFASVYLLCMSVFLSGYLAEVKKRPV